MCLSNFKPRVKKRRMKFRSRYESCLCSRNMYGILFKFICLSYGSNGHGGYCRAMATTHVQSAFGPQPTHNGLLRSQRMYGRHMAREVKSRFLEVYLSTELKTVRRYQNVPPAPRSPGAACTGYYFFGSWPKKKSNRSSY